MPLTEVINLKQFCKDNGIRFNKHPRPVTAEQIKILRDALYPGLSHLDDTHNLEYCLLVIGNGSWWCEETGTLQFNWPTQKQHEKDVAWNKTVEENRRKEEIELHGSEEEYEAAVARRKELLKKFDLGDLDDNKPREFYPISNHSRVCQVPDNVTAHWYRNCLTVLGYVINAEPSERNDYNRPIAQRIMNELLERFKDKDWRATDG